MKYINDNDDTTNNDNDAYWLIVLLVIIDVIDVIATDISYDISSIYSTKYKDDDQMIMMMIR